MNQNLLCNISNILHDSSSQCTLLSGIVCFVPLMLCSSILSLVKKQTNKQKKTHKKTIPRINHDKDSGKKELAFTPILVACFQIKEIF